MNRRDAISVLGSAALVSVAQGQQAPAPPAFYKSRLSDIDDVLKIVKKGAARVLAKSAGKRDIHLVTYGEKPAGRSQANYNSACGGNMPAAYRPKDGKQKPVVFLLGPVHGAEFEGIVGLVNLLHVAETGQDHRGQAWKRLAENMERCRVLIVPCGNPDGRARCPVDSWVGEELSYNERIGMGVQPNGENYSWPSVKRIHPLHPQAVRTLGAYFNDDGINPCTTNGSTRWPAKLARSCG